ncbi:hypothetical protein L227DRAFT_496578 [Lentinus tigrinus ALCF2SS1-6]|uniref:Uncharacterized protein n=1 Tax=Lentinus tigrinus ALCF2SS1-6 TaxID=1328759 RepID=A0A5C2SJ53_9APHY|nr:hypothetical protein L227DRAFT_496578 [Lentinus tigrinus ALCF2SS1-6]
MSALLRTQPLRASLRAAPPLVRAAASRPRTYATIPDPTQPTDKPSPNDIPKPQGGSNTGLFVIAGLAAAGGGYYYYSTREPDPHAQRKADEERVKEKIAELRSAGKATAHDAVREGQSKYEETKSSAQDKLASARAQASQTVDDARSTAVRQYDNAKATVVDATHKVEQKVDAAAAKTKADAQSWNQWFWSWFGYGQAKADQAKREGAEKVVEGAQKVEKEAGKHT